MATNSSTSDHIGGAVVLPKLSNLKFVQHSFLSEKYNISTKITQKKHNSVKKQSGLCI